MKMIYLLVAIIIIAGLIYYSSKNKHDGGISKNLFSITQQKDTAHQDKDNPYEGLRGMALDVTPDHLQLTLPNDQTKVYGVVMDWDIGSGIATLISFETGDASMYLSSGGGMIGGGQHENVSKAVRAFVDKAQTYLGKTNKIEKTPLPDKNSVRFYLLTNKGKFSAQENLKNFGNNTSDWLPLFEEGNKVISELRVQKENQ
jgi:hypothetical protein